MNAGDGQKRFSRKVHVPCSKLGISRRLSPLGVLLPFLTSPKNPPTACLHPASPSSPANVPQNSRRTSLGSLTSPSDLFRPIFSPNEDFFSARPGPGLGGWEEKVKRLLSEEGRENEGEERRGGVG